MRSRCWLCVLVLVAVSATSTLGARIRPGADPRTDRVIWADPFDNYSQWAWDNQSNPAYAPRYTLWQGGPTPAGSASGGYPRKSDNGTSSPNNGCGVEKQTSPSMHYLGRQQWVINQYGNEWGDIWTSTGLKVAPSHFFADSDEFVPGSNCGSGGWVETIAEFGRLDCVWQSYAGYYSSLGILTHDLVPRIQSWTPLRAWDQASPNAVQGTDEHPLTLFFDLHDSGGVDNPRSWANNSYVELNLDDEHAPTDYIWRGRRDMSYESGHPECCPWGPYPIICQQAREVNAGNFEQQIDLDYLNAHCPSLVPPFDQQTGTGRTWPAIAFGFMAIGCKDPCTCMEQGSGSHRPAMNHPMLFDGNVWRELRTGRGTALTQCPPAWATDPVTGNTGYELSMQDSGGGQSGNFSLAGGTHRVYMKLTTNKILIWMMTRNADSSENHYCGAFDRVYKGPFNRVAFGVGPGCELKDKATDGDDYACKPGGTPTQYLTYTHWKTDSESLNYTDGYHRAQIDSMGLLDGVLVQNSNMGACCKPDGECVLTTQGDCQLLNGFYHGANTLCESYVCCPRPFADTDADGDVDQDDFGAFQLCYNGSGAAPTGCECLDRNKDGKVDSIDFTAFNNCFTGPNVPWSQVATPTCNP